jgi:peptidoglycan-N-acetylglucosamine deacetylase
MRDVKSRLLSSQFFRCNLHRIILAYIILAAIIILIYGWPAIWLSVPAVLMVLLVTIGIARPGSSIFYPTITHGPRDSNRIALSFDDGPDPEITPLVLDLLADANARATFFVIGKWLVAHPELAKRIVADGHVLGNHSWNHSRLQNFYFTKRHIQEIEECERIIKKITGNSSPVLYRPPIGLKSGELASAAYHCNLTLVAWSLHSHDTLLKDPQKIARRVLKNIRGGDIVLLHDGYDLRNKHRPYTVHAVQLILEGLRAKSLECVSIPELLNLSTTS